MAVEGYAARALDPRLQHRAHLHQGPHARPGYPPGTSPGRRAARSATVGSSANRRSHHPTINPFINPDGEKNLYNSRQPSDDVYSMRFAWLTHGKVPPCGLKPHDDLQARFPYLGPPNR